MKYEYYVVYKTEGATGWSAVHRKEPISNVNQIKELAEYLKNINNLSSDVIITNWTLLRTFDIGHTEHIMD